MKSLILDPNLVKALVAYGHKRDSAASIATA
jgi:hypothetical protein